MIYKNIKELITLKPALLKDGRFLRPDDLGLLKDVSLLEEDGIIKYIGSFEKCQKLAPNELITDAKDLIITPGIIDSHTHLVFGGNRAFEYTMKIDGKSYEEIASFGGGILNTMTHTRKINLEDLYHESKEKLGRLISYGISMVEIKSGYALNYEKEKEISLLIKKLKDEYQGRIDIFNTMMAAHAIPPEYKSSHLYIKEVVIPLMDELHKNKIIDAVDIFHEKNYFSDEDVNLLFNFAKKINLPRKIHVDELNDNNGASLAVTHEALSCDHLLLTNKKGIEALSKSKTVATLLPGTAFFLGKKLADARAFLDAGVKVALASDYNPGSCHCDNLLLIAQLSAKYLKMNSAELWAAITLNAASALGAQNRGAITEGMLSKFSIFKADSHHEIFYNWGKNLSVKI